MPTVLIFLSFFVIMFLAFYVVFLIAKYERDKDKRK